MLGCSGSQRIHIVDVILRNAYVCPRMSGAFISEHSCLVYVSLWNTHVWSRAHVTQALGTARHGTCVCAAPTRAPLLGRRRWRPCCTTECTRASLHCQYVRRRTCKGLSPTQAPCTAISDVPSQTLYRSIPYRTKRRCTFTHTLLYQNHIMPWFIAAVDITACGPCLPYHPNRCVRVTQRSNVIMTSSCCRYRNAMSVISAVDLLVERTVFTGTNGTNPMAGVDLEPDYPHQNFRNVQ